MASQSLRSRIIAMEVGEGLSLSVAEANGATLRGYATNIGFDMNRQYSVHRNREERLYTIIRHS